MSLSLRRLLSTGLIAVGLAALLASTLTLYVRDHVLDSSQFADSAVASVDDAAVGRIVSEQITVRVINRAAPNLVTLKPIVESAVGSLLTTGPLRRAIRVGVLNAHRAVFDRGADNAVLQIANVGGVLRAALEQVDPQLAAEIPKDLDVRLLRFADQPVLVDAAQAADSVDRWAGILPALTLAIFGLAIIVAPRRRRTIARLGISLVGFAVTVAVAVAVARLAVLDHVPAGDSRDAGSAIWHEYLGDMRTWLLVIGGTGVLLATAAAAFGRGGSLLAPLSRGWSRIAEEPEGGRSRTTWAAGIFVAGLLIVLASDLIIRLVIVGSGAYLLARGGAALAAEAAAAVGWKPGAARRGAVDREPPEAALTVRDAGIGLAIVAALALTVGIGLSAALRSDEATPSVFAGPADPGCNGSEALCDRPLDRTAFFATHNSFAGSDYPGFLFAEQEGTIPSQLVGGVRGLWIDTYYGVPGRRVYTRTDLIDPALNAQLRQDLGPELVDAATSIRSRIAKPPADAPTHIYLCHGFCELGAVDAGETFVQIRKYLEANPREVLIIDLEDYTRPDDTVKLLEKSGLADLIYKGPNGPPWPTLGQMVTSGGRVLLVVEHRTKGAPSWYRPAYEEVFQETPFDFKTPAEMSCAANRGGPDNSLFLINHWISTDPTPRPTNAAKVNAYDFLLDRARRCERQRDAFPNVLNVDFWKQGDTQGVVDTLNGVG